MLIITSESKILLPYEAIAAMYKNHCNKNFSWFFRVDVDLIVAAVHTAIAEKREIDKVDINGRFIPLAQFCQPGVAEAHNKALR